MSWDAGSSTRSIKCTTPLRARMSVVVIWATRLRPSVMRKAVSDSTLKNPSPSGSIALPSGTSLRKTREPSTWKVSTWVSKALSASKACLLMPSSVSKAANAALVGANTVTVEVDSVSVKPAATTASTRMLRSGVAWANCTTLGSSAASSPPPQACSSGMESPSAAPSSTVRRGMAMDGMV